MLAGLEIIAPAPAALPDDLAHRNLPGPGHASRWQDVAELLAAGIDVITTVSTGQLDSLADIAQDITGVPAGPAVPDPVVRAADEIELVDVTPEALRDRIARGHLYPPGHAEAALSGAFRAGPLAALRELALLWLAADGHGDDGDGRPARERIMVALPAEPTCISSRQGPPGWPDRETRVRSVLKIFYFLTDRRFTLVLQAILAL
jgi:two-component system, OmpR family, sensor histidine kinase KdpD